MNLYSDNHPKTSLKHTGFKNIFMALQTIKLISNRSLKYQYDVINTMYNRAKYHPNQTNDMLKAMKIFNKWLKNYKNKDKLLYPFLSLITMRKYLKIAKQCNIDTNFYKIYKKVKEKSCKLQYILYKNSNKMDYWSYRIKIIKKFKDKSLYTKSGKLNKNHIILIMHAYSPNVNNFLFS